MMKKYLAMTSALILLVFWPTMAQEISAPVQPPLPERLHSGFEMNYLDTLSKMGRDLEDQGLYIESLDGSTILADHQSTVGFNPASVIKIATSFAALDKLGPEYRFETSFQAAGEIKPKTKTLEGDLVLAGTGDPVLTTPQLNLMIRDVIRKHGIARVTGNLVVTGKFTYAGYQTTATATKRLEALLKKQGIRFDKKTKKGSTSGKVLGEPRVSPSLRSIVFNQNAHSDNQIADRLGEAIGGPQAVREFLMRGVGIPESDLKISYASGLGENRITPQGTVKLLRHLVLWLNFNNLLPQDVLPVAGYDEGTLLRRFTNVDYRGSVIGKTGTLPATDGGVSTLAGFVFTRDRGVLLFAIFNTKGNVSTFRKLQDRLIMDLIQESGGAELSATLRRSGN